MQSQYADALIARLRNRNPNSAMVEERSIKITGAKVSTDRVTAGFDADTGDLPRFYAHIHTLLAGVFPSLRHPHMAAFVAEHAHTPIGSIGVGCDGPAVEVYVETDDGRIVSCGVGPNAATSGGGGVGPNAATSGGGGVGPNAATSGGSYAVINDWQNPMTRMQTFERLRAALPRAAYDIMSQIVDAKTCTLAFERLHRDYAIMMHLCPMRGKLPLDAVAVPLGALAALANLEGRAAMRGWCDAKPGWVLSFLSLGVKHDGVLQMTVYGRSR
jgi:hypothetical protein